MIVKDEQQLLALCGELSGVAAEQVETKLKGDKVRKADMLALQRAWQNV